MLDRLKNISFIKGNSSTGVHIIINPDGLFELKYVLLKKKKTKINIEKKSDKFKDLLSLIENIPASSPISISIDGKGIIHKKISCSESDTNKDLLNKIMPNASIDDFFITTIPIDENNCFASIIRNEVLNEILDVFKEKKRFVIDINLGPYTINTILEFLNEKREKISAGNYQLKIKNNTIVDYIKEEKQGFPNLYRLGDEDIYEDYIEAFSNAFGYFISNSDETSPEIIEHQKNEFLYRQLFVIAGWSIMILLFSILLVNYLFFDHYNKKQNRLSIRVEQNKNLLNRLDTLSKELMMKEDFIAKSDFLSSTKQSYYADRLANTVPKYILLEKMDLQPLIKKMKNGTEPLFQKNAIIISGLSNNSSVFNNWIKDLNKEEWISELEVLNYSQEDERSSGNFEVEILLQEMDNNLN